MERTRKKSLARLAETIRRETAQERAVAAVALGAFPGPTATEILKSALSDRSKAVRIAVIAALARMGTAEARECLRSALTDKNRDVRRAAAEKLEVLGLPDDAHTRALWCVAGEHWESAVAMGADAVAALGSTLCSGTDNSLPAAESLAAIGPESTATLCGALHHENPSVRKAAADALEKVGVPDNPITRSWWAVAGNHWQLAADMAAAYAPGIRKALDFAALHSDMDARLLAADLISTHFGTAAPRQSSEKDSSVRSQSKQVRIRQRNLELGISSGRERRKADKTPRGERPQYFQKLRKKRERMEGPDEIEQRCDGCGQVVVLRREGIGEEFRVGQWGRYYGELHIWTYGSDYHVQLCDRCNQQREKRAR